MIIIIDGVNTIFTYISLKYVTCDVVVIVVDDEMTQNAFYIFFFSLDDINYYEHIRMI